MKKDDLENLFERLEGQFDFEEPSNGHQERFLEKLNQKNGSIALHKKKNWLRPLSIAASVVLLFGLAFQFFLGSESLEEQVVEIAPEVSKTEFYFASLVDEQVQQLQSEKTPETARLVDDTMAQLQKLDGDYQQLERDLINGGNKELILNAMIINFQTRIDLLKEVLTNIKDIKNLKQQNDENFTI